MNKDFFSQLFYSDKGWFFIKLLIGIRWLMKMVEILTSATQIVSPIGLCSVFPCGILSNSIVLSTILLLCFISVATYIFFERYAIPALSSLLILSLLIISFHESTGVFIRASLFSMIWIGQLVAYILHKKNIENLRKFRHQYMIQLICATYFLAALSKLSDAGWAWPQQGSDYFALSCLKGYYYSFFDSGNIEQLNAGYKLAYLLLEHKQLVFGLMLGALLLELTSPLAALEKRLTFLYGIMLLLMHIGIKYTMGITIGGTYYSMLAFMLNPLGLFYFSFIYLKGLYHKKALTS